MLVAVSGVGASVRARWMCSVRQSSASSEKYELVVTLRSDASKVLRDLRAGEQLEEKEVGSDTYAAVTSWAARSGRVSMKLARKAPGAMV